jgi:Zn-dependent protease
MQTRELRDITISAIVLAIAFSWGGRFGSLVEGFVLALLFLSAGFILHEFAHRYIAKKFNYHAEFRMWKQGLFLALLFALITNGSVVFAAPGAVVIQPRADLWGNVRHIGQKGLGLISIAGPAANIAIALLFILAGFFIAPLLFWGATINLWLAGFNLIPFPPLDGYKIFAWDKRIWAVMIVIVGILFATAI